MTKAYDVSGLLEKMKANGLDLAEAAAKVAIKSVCEWVVESAALSENKVDDLVALGIPELEKLALGLADKIDGKVQA